MTARHQEASHPLHLLDDLLASLTSREVPHEPAAATPRGALVAEATTGHDERREDLILRAADDLFGPHASLLENALALLDEHRSSRRGVDVVGEGGRGTSRTAPPAMIRRIRARRSGREAVLVRRGRASSGRKRAPRRPDDEEEEDGKRRPDAAAEEHYLCLLGREERDRGASRASGGGGGRTPPRVRRRRGMHCTCRAFFQNVGGGGGIGGGGGASPVGRGGPRGVPGSSPDAVVCKHLLAAILLPHLLPAGDAEAEIVDDRDFAWWLARASVG